MTVIAMAEILGTEVDTVLMAMVMAEDMEMVTVMATALGMVEAMEMAMEADTAQGMAVDMDQAIAVQGIATLMEAAAAVGVPEPQATPTKKLATKERTQPSLDSPVVTLQATHLVTLLDMATQVKIQPNQGLLETQAVTHLPIPPDH